MPDAVPTESPPSAVAMFGRLYCTQIINLWKCYVMSSPLIKTSKHTLILTFKTCLLRSHRSYTTIYATYCHIARLWLHLSWNPLLDDENSSHKFFLINNRYTDNTKIATNLEGRAFNFTTNVTVKFVSYINKMYPNPSWLTIICDRPCSVLHLQCYVPSSSISNGNGDLYDFSFKICHSLSIITSV